jgi:hypothetical protein
VKSNVNAISLKSPIFSNCHGDSICSIIAYVNRTPLYQQFLKRLKILSRDKRTSLFGRRVNDKEEEMYKIDTEIYLNVFLCVQIGTDPNNNFTLSTCGVSQ